MSEKCAPLRREAHFQVKMHQNAQSTPFSDYFWKFTYRKSGRRYGGKHISTSKCKKHHMLGPVLKVQIWFCVAGARDSAPCQKRARREGFVAFPKTMAGVGHLKRIWKDARDMFIRDVRRSGR